MKKSVPVWEVLLPGAVPLVVSAYTAGEARAAAKRLLGLKDRLPVGTICRRLS